MSASPLTYAGLQIIEDQPQQKIRIADDCPCSSEMRCTMNAWLLAMFGYTTIVPRGTAWILYNRFAIMHPADVIKLSMLR